MNTASLGIRLLTSVFLASLAATFCGCHVAKLPVNAVGLVVPLSKSDHPDPAMLQGALQRCSDEYLDRTMAALEDYARSGTPEAAREALFTKVAVGSSVIGIVSGPNPTANLIDLLALATTTRTALEEHWVKTIEGEAVQSWLKASRTLETNAWKLADQVLTPAQQQEIRESIHQWWQANADSRGTFFLRPQPMTTFLKQSPKKSTEPGNVLALVGLDPTVGLDPAVREVTRTRLFAERALYTAQRMPFLLRWQIQLLADQLLYNSPLENALTNISSLAASADRLSRSSESVSQTAAQLPDRLTAERKAILDALDTQEGRLRELSAEISRTLMAGEKMSTSLNTTIGTFDALMKRFGVGEPPRGPKNTNSRPYNILEYAETADRLALMAKELDVLIKDVNGTLDSPAAKQRAQNLSAVADRAKADARSLLNHFFLLATGLVLLTFACALVYRRLVPRRSNPPGHTTEGSDEKHRGL